MVDIVATGTTITHDETAGLQNSASFPPGDADDDDVAFTSLPDVFKTLLATVANGATALGAAESPSNVVTFSDLSGVFNIALTDANGNPLDNVDKQ